jgi:endonuclease-3 related protein
MKTVTPSELYTVMFREMGHQHWWPSEKWVETIIGSILIQNASARTVDPVIESVGEATGFDPWKLHNMKMDELVALIKPAGLYNSKAKYIKAALDYFHQFDFDLSYLTVYDTADLRRKLKAIPGIGNETVDVWLVYIFNRPKFIGDSYSRRLAKYMGAGDMDYLAIQAKMEASFDMDLPQAREFHAMIDEFGKLYLGSEKKFRESWLADYQLEF